MKAESRQQLGDFLHKFASAKCSFESYLGSCDGRDAPWENLCYYEPAKLPQTRQKNKARDQRMRQGDGMKNDMARRHGAVKGQWRV